MRGNEEPVSVVVDVDMLKLYITSSGRLPGAFAKK